VLIIFVQISQGRRNESTAYYYFRANLKRINIAIAEYANGHSGKMPDAQVWADLITKQNKLIMEEDFMAPSEYGKICYNANLSNKLYSDLKGNTVTLFMARGDWNVNGNKDWFYENSVHRKHSYLITLDGLIYRHDPDHNTFFLLDGEERIPYNLIW
jgi:hypothetical protein